MPPGRLVTRLGSLAKSSTPGAGGNTAVPCRFWPRQRLPVRLLARSAGPGDRPYPWSGTTVPHPLKLQFDGDGDLGRSSRSVMIWKVSSG